MAGVERLPLAVAQRAAPPDADHRARLVETRAIGDVVLLRYALSDRFAG